MVDTFQVRVRREDLMNDLTRSDSSIAVEKRRIATRLSKKALGESKLSAWPSFCRT